MQPHQPHAAAAMVHVKHTQPDLRPVVIAAPAYEEVDPEQQAAYAAQMAEYQMKQDAMAANAQAVLENVPSQFFAPGPPPMPPVITVAPAQDTFRLKRKQMPIKK